MFKTRSLVTDSIEHFAMLFAYFFIVVVGHHFGVPVLTQMYNIYYVILHTLHLV